jgi:hypothetical protein
MYEEGTVKRAFVSEPLISSVVPGLLLGLVILGIVLGGCTKLRYTANTSEVYAPVAVDSVVVFSTIEELTASGRKFNVIGQATAEGDTFAGKESMRKMLVARAAREGADAVVFADEMKWGPNHGAVEYVPTIGRMRTEQPHGSGKEIRGYFLKFK